MKRILFAAFALLFGGCLVQAQEYRHLDQVQELPSFGSVEEWLGRASYLRTHILASAGLLPLSERSPLNAQVTQAVTKADYQIQNLVLETLPDFYLVGNIYRPVGKRGPFPAVLSPHGHWKAGRLENTHEASIPGRGISLARQGYVVLTYSMVGYNEMEKFIPHRFDQPAYQLWGFSPMGLQLWNSMRALDYLTSLPDVDPGRIAMTGASGGGTQTFLLTAVDSRIRASAPVNMISAHFQGGCVCENGPLLRINCNNLEIGALAAPRPLMMISTSGDWTKNTPKIEFPALRGIYDLFGAKDRVDNVHLDYPHNYNKDSRQAVYSWLNRWFMGDPARVSEQPFELEDPKALESRLPGVPVGIETLFSEFVKRCEREIERAAPENWGDLFALRESYGQALRHALSVGKANTGPGDRLSLTSPPDRDEARPAVLIVSDGTSAAREQCERLKGSCLDRGSLVFVLHQDGPYGVAPKPNVNHWNTYNPTPAALRVAEIRAALRSIESRPEVLSTDLVGLGASGSLVLLARAFEPSVRSTSVDLSQSPTTDTAFVQALFVPLLRKAGDFRTAVAMIAPSPLVIQGSVDPALAGWFRAVYKAAGAQDMLRFASGH